MTIQIGSTYISDSMTNII